MRDQKKYCDYDRICAIACGELALDIATAKKEKKKISIVNFDAKNKEHLFALYQIKGYASVLGEYEIRIKTSRQVLRTHNKGMDKDCRFKKYKRRERKNCYLIFMDKVVTQIKNRVSELEPQLSSTITLSEIYDAYFDRKGKEN